MVTDPYAVLGLPRTASADEVKAAYRRLAKKYHPDLNPGSVEAERKMKEINEAYDMIVNHKYDPNASSSAYGSSGSSYGQSGQSYTGGNGYYRGYADPFETFRNGFGGWGAYSRNTESSQMRAVRNYIDSGCYAEALNVLSTITQKDAYWYYLSALANEGAGNHLNALDHAGKASAMEPSNFEYRNLLNRLKYADGADNSYSDRFTMPKGGLYPALICLILNCFCSRYGFFCC